MGSVMRFMSNTSFFIKISISSIVMIILILFGLSFIINLNYSQGWRNTLVLGLVLIISIGYAWVTSRFLINRPIHKLIDGMNRLANKEYDYRLPDSPSEEFGTVTSSFNEMASMLSTSLNELKKNQDYLRSILESSADLIITVNPSERIQTINTGAEKVLGYSRQEVIGRPIQMLFADPHEREIAIEKLQYTDNVVNYETRFLTKEADIRNVLLTLSRMRNADGEVIGTIGIKILQRKKTFNKS
jgi:PAS domain S-box-containing protein